MEDDLVAIRYRTPLKRDRTHNPWCRHSLVEDIVALRVVEARLATSVEVSNAATSVEVSNPAAESFLGMEISLGMPRIVILIAPHR